MRHVEPVLDERLEIGAKRQRPAGRGRRRQSRRRASSATMSASRLIGGCATAPASRALPGGPFARPPAAATDPGRRANGRSTRPASRARQLTLDIVPRGRTVCVTRRRYARARAASRGGRVKARVVERATREARIEHGGEIAERQVPRHAGDERVEAFVGRARLREKRAHLPLPDLEANAERGEVRLNELFRRVVRAADGEQLERERDAGAPSDAVAAAHPACGVEQRSGVRGVLARPLRQREGVIGRNGARRGRRVAGEGRIDDALAIDRERDRAADARVIERRPLRVEHDAIRDENRIIHDAQRRIRRREAAPSMARCRPCRAPGSQDPANFVDASSTTATTTRSSAGGPPNDRAKSGLRANVQRWPNRRPTNRKGPFPVGRSPNGARRSSERGTSASRWAGAMGCSHSTSGKSRLRPAVTNDDGRIIGERRCVRHRRAPRIAASRWTGRARRRG